MDGHNAYSHASYMSGGDSVQAHSPMFPYKEPETRINGFSPSASRQLPPKTLSRRSGIRNFTRHFLVSVTAACVLTGAIVFGVVPYYYFNFDNKTRIDISDDQCDKQAATSVERAFVIDIRLGGNFSFVQAKMIDLLWDLIVGQGGRFLHAWVLIRWVVSDVLVWTMERSSVPYSYFVELSFSTVSFSSLWEILKILMKRRNWRTVMSALWLLYAIGYVLAFATFWSAATGYIAPASRMYPMPDGSLEPVDSPNLSLCWVLDGDRLGQGEDYIEEGPDFESLYANHMHYVDLGIDFASSSTDVWWTMDMSPDANVSDNFWNIYAYAKGMRDIQFWLNYTGAAKHYHETALTGTPLSGHYDMNEDEGYMYQANDAVPPPQYDRVPEAAPSGLPKTLLGWAYPGMGQELEIPNDQLVSDWIEGGAYHATFILDENIAPGPGILPYNSTIWFNNQASSLRAPFLDVGKACPGQINFYTTLGNCVCYRGEPLATDWYSELTCVNKRAYAWGFASLITLILFCLEAIWAVGCWSVWMDANINSRLLLWRRKGAGTLRGALDLAESVKRDLGPDTCAYGDGELIKELEKCEPIGYAVDEMPGGVAHIGLVPESVQQRVEMEGGRFYGKGS